MSENPVLGALEAFNRTHPHREIDPDEVLAQAATALDEDSEPDLAVTPAADDTGSEEPSVLFDGDLARAAAEQGMERAERAARVQRWKTAAVAYVRDMHTGTELTADDVIAALGLPDPSAGPATNNVVGAVFSSLSKAEVIVFTGRFKASERVIGHGNLQRVWRRA